jgi:hypothetical protein
VPQLPNRQATDDDDADKDCCLDAQVDVVSDGAGGHEIDDGLHCSSLQKVPPRQEPRGGEVTGQAVGFGQIPVSPMAL